MRVSTDDQDIQSQRLQILDYANKHGMHVDEFIIVQISSRRSTKERRIDELLKRLYRDDILIVAELSRIGRSLGQVIQIVNELVKNKVRFISIRENITLSDGIQDIGSKVQIAMFGLFAEIERDLISERIRNGLIAARGRGRSLGRPKGKYSNSKLTGKEQFVRECFEKKVGICAMSRLLGVSRPTILNFAKTRGIIE